MKWPWVSRTAYEAVVSERDWLRAEHARLTAPKEPKAVVVERSRTDAQAVRVVEDGFVNRVKAHLTSHGLPDAIADAEATRIRRETTGARR